MMKGPAEFRSLVELSQDKQNALRMMRWKCRTDLGYLCREVLGYPDVSDIIHAPLLNMLQKFPVPDKEQFLANDKIGPFGWEYKPLVRMPQLVGGRRKLILDFRGSLKTTINAQSHTIQWIINYPDCAIMVIQSNLEKAEMILGEIKRHFQYNQRFRLLFPEHCPIKNIDDFGTKSKFTTRGRGRSITRKEDTVMASSIDAGTSGTHCDILKFSDIVEPSNTGTAEQMQSVIKSFNMSENLLVGPNYWMDVEGTRYDYGDAYGNIIKKEGEMPEHLRRWEIYVRGCYVKDTGAKEPKYTPEELTLPDKVDKAGKKVLTWDDSERGFTLEAFEAKRLTDPFIFSCQQQNAPRGGIDGRDIFPVSDEYPVKISRKDFKQNVRVAFYVATIDTAETKTERSNHSCITVAAFSNDGKVYVNEVIHGKFLPDELLTKIIDLTSLKRKGFIYGPNLQSIKIEETSFVRGFGVALRHHMHIKNDFLPIEYIKRDNQLSKQERIQSTLQPYYASKQIIFLDDIEPWDELIDELRQFPKGLNDDILDTLADLFQDKTWFGREKPRYTPEQSHSLAVEKWLGIDSPFDPDSYLDSPTSNLDPIYQKTGG